MGHRSSVVLAEVDYEGIEPRIAISDGLKFIKRYPQYIETINEAGSSVKTHEKYLYVGLKGVREGCIRLINDVESPEADDHLMTYAQRQLKYIVKKLRAADVLVPVVRDFDLIARIPTVLPRRQLGCLSIPDVCPVSSYDYSEGDYAMEKYRTQIIRSLLVALKALTLSQSGVESLCFKENRGFPKWLKRAASGFPLDAQVQEFVKRILRELNRKVDPVKRIREFKHCEPELVDIMNDTVDMQEVQFAAIQHIQDLLKSALDDTIVELRTSGALIAISSCLKIYPSDKRICIHAFSIFATAASDTINRKIIAQLGGIKHLITTLRDMRLEDVEAQTAARARGNDPDSIYTTTSYTAKDLAQAAIWALDALCNNDSNLLVMKQNGLPYLLQELLITASNPDKKHTILVPHRLQEVQWDQMAIPLESAESADFEADATGTM